MSSRMISNKLLLKTVLFSKTARLNVNAYYSTVQKKVQVSLFGAANYIGSNLALLLKQNENINRLVLYDDDVIVKGMEIELSHIPSGPQIQAYSGYTSLETAVQGSDLIVMVCQPSNKSSYSREHLIATNAPTVQKICLAIANRNPDSFIAIATDPVNSMVPFASSILYKHGCYNPFKIFGVTQIDLLRTRALTANTCKIDPADISLPVIGGRSDETIVPLFSNMKCSKINLSCHQASTLTLLARKAATEVVNYKQGIGSSILAMAMSISEFVNLIVNAIKGDEVTVNSYTANPNFGTRFFSGPTKVGPYGLMQACHGYEYSDYEASLLKMCVSVLNRDVELGENYVRYIEMIRNY